MPIQKIRGGFRYGKTGKIYKGARARAKAAKQGIAIELSKLRKEGRVVERKGRIIQVKANKRARGYERKL